MGYIDVDSHVIEGMETWEYLAESEQEHRPRVAELDTAVAISGLGKVMSSAPHAKIWLVGDTWSPYFRADGNARGNANVYHEGATLLTDLDRRIADLDVLGIDVQLLISSFWLGTEVPHPPAELALTRAWNRWMADKVGPYKQRLPWTMRVPMHSLHEAAKEMSFAKEHGAATVLLRGIEHGYHLSDSYFHQLFAAAQDHDLAILVHLGDPIRELKNATIGRHNDIGTELGAHFELLARTDLSDEVKRKIVDTNGRRYLGVPESFRPASADTLVAPPNVRGAATEDGHPLLSLSHR